MSAIRKLIDRARSDEGMSLVEVVVALMVFALIALGVGYSTITILKMTEDTRSRQVATNLATSEIDTARGLQDPFLVTNTTKTAVVSGKTYTIVRSSSWVTTTGADIGCGTGSGTLQSKRVNVTVTWTGMLTTTQPVRSDTLISPDERINDPSLGTIRISVLNVAGTGTAGVAVSVTATSGGAPLSAQPSPTDTDGCSFALKVTPGTYDVTISRSSSVDTNQASTSTKSVVVTAGGSVAAQFQYDYAAIFNVSYASNQASGTAALLPSNLDTTYLSTYGAYIDSSGPKVQVLLHPVPSGYAGIAGKYIAPVAGNAGCINVDPASWPEGVVSGTAYAAGVRTANVAAAPQGSATMNIPMGLMTVVVPSNSYLFAVSSAAPAGSGDPGCSAAPTYSFGKQSGSKTIALPYGSWTLYSGSKSNGSNMTPIPAANLGLIGSILTFLGGGTTVTLDPRQPK